MTKKKEVVRTHKWSRVTTLLNQYAEGDPKKVMHLPAEIVGVARRSLRVDVRAVTNLGTTVAATVHSQLSKAHNPAGARALVALIRREALVRSVERTRAKARLTLTATQYKKMTEQLIEDALRQAFKEIGDGHIRAA